MALLKVYQQFSLTKKLLNYKQNFVTLLLNNESQNSGTYNGQFIIC